MVTMALAIMARLLLRLPLTIEGNLDAQVIDAHRSAYGWRHGMVKLRRSDRHQGRVMETGLRVGWASGLRVCKFFCEALSR